MKMNAAKQPWDALLRDRSERIKKSQQEVAEVPVLGFNFSPSKKIVEKPPQKSSLPQPQKLLAGPPAWPLTHTSDRLEPGSPRKTAFLELPLPFLQFSDGVGSVHLQNPLFFSAFD